MLSTATLHGWLFLTSPSLPFVLSVFFACFHFFLFFDCGIAAVHLTAFVFSLCSVDCGIAAVRGSLSVGLEPVVAPAAVGHEGNA